jgi:type IV secretion system protein VirB10
MVSRTLALLILPAAVILPGALGQDAASQPVQSKGNASELRDRPAGESGERAYTVKTGTKVLLSMVNTVSTKSAQPGDQLYLETSFPIFVNSRMVIPPGSYVMGTITQSIRPGKIKGKGEFFLRFDSLTLPNGVTRDFHAALSNMDGNAAGTVDRTESGVKSDGSIGKDMKTIGIATASGAGIGGLATIHSGTPMGVPIGGAAGAAVGLAAVLLTRGPDAELVKGTSVEMVLDRDLQYSEGELDFAKAPPQFHPDPGQPPPGNRPVLNRP